MTIAERDLMSLTTRKSALSVSVENNIQEKILSSLSSRDAERFISYRKEWNALENDPQRHIDFPLNLYCEPVADCNLSCVFCPTSKKPSLWRERVPGFADGTYLPFDLFKKAIDEGEKYSLPALWHGISGEALLHKDTPAMIRYATDHGLIDKIIITNGTLLTPEKSAELIDAGLTRISISVNAFQRETYEKLSGKDMLEQVKFNIDNLIAEKEKRKTLLPILRLTYVETDANQGETEQYIEHWRDKVDQIDIRKCAGWEYLDDPTEIANIKYSPCIYPQRNISLWANGMITPCIHWYSKETLCFGNIRKTTLKDVWNSNAYQQHMTRALGMDENCDIACKRCQAQYNNL